MLHTEFFLLDVDYVTGSTGRGIIRLFGRTVDEKRVCVYDDHFEPYFYVLPRQKQEIRALMEKLKALKINEPSRIAHVTRVELEKKKLLGHDVDVVKVFVNNPKDVKVLRGEMRHFKEVLEVYEADIPFYRRYLIDKNITPLTFCVAQGEEIEENVRADVVLKASLVQQKGEVFMKNPRILGFDIEVSSPHKSPDGTKDPIVMVAFYGSDGYSKIITWKKFKNPKKYIEFVEDEGNLLLKVKEVIQDYKPDYLTGYYSDGFDFPYLRERADKYGIKLTLGLDKSAVKFSTRQGSTTAKIVGIAHIDVFKFLKRVMSELFHVQSYSLDVVGKKLLGEGKKDIDVSTLFVVWNNNDEEKLREFCEYNLHDAKLAYRLTNIMMPHLNEFVKTVGLPVDDVSRMSFGQIVEWYMIKQMKQFNELIPNRPSHPVMVQRDAESYEGAFVFEPKAGLYRDVIVFDFRSLYPTIITAHNICVSTIASSKKDAQPSPKMKVKGKNVHYYFNHKKIGFIPTILKDVLMRRNRIKDMMTKDTKKDPILNARQYSLKIVANSFYGYFGFSGARWYSNECAAAITAYGRDYIQKMIAQARKAGFDVIYSDTDSVFLSLGEKSKKDAMMFLKEMNRELPSLMELEYDGFYPRGLFVAKKSEAKGAKKKYALVDEDGDIKVTGFETVRGDWSLLAKEVQKKVFEIILREKDEKKALNYVKDTIKKIEKKEIPMEKMVIKKQLKKDIADYENIGPHVQVAKLLKKRGENVGAGSIITYVVNEGKGIIRDRAKPLEDSETYDAEYYIHNQVIPVVIAIFDVLGHSKEELFDHEQSTLGEF
jgi:DNA polymerase, archaea type